ncbi:glycosyltransferase family 2 protein [Salinibacter ruber]|uniref:glycosyltransferase family 2 protein n=1 Tax=Salinibacter ruber TaxID=146919 RepID=UPI0021688C9F|nr:glycosyltransferase family 2 protein [Salinibacter ruber]MCS4142573.1 glycosyltransferase involved in cell wall biosynthesis [Salinibacter ruber]
MEPTSITPLILTYNEESNLDRTLGRLTWADRVVVVDSYSEDATVDIASSYENVDLVQREFDDHTSQWNYGLDQVETDWVLSLDADYRVPPEFVDEVEALNLSSVVAGYRATFRYCVFGRPLRANLYPPRVVLFRTERASYEQDGHTQRLTVDGTVEELDTVLKHDDRKSLDRWFDNQRQYARLEAQKLREADDLELPDRLRRTDVWGPLLVPLYCLFRKGLILDGWPGWYYTLQRTYAELVIALTHLDAYLRTSDDHSSNRG